MAKGKGKYDDGKGKGKYDDDDGKGKGKYDDDGKGKGKYDDDGKGKGKYDDDGKGKGKAGKNEDPHANDDSASVDEDSSVKINVLANDSDPDSDPILVQSFSQPPNGTVTLNGDGTLQYTPDPNFNGTETFTYTIVDSEGATDTATVTVTVDPENDDPVAVNDSRSVDEDSSLDIDVLGNDSDLDGDTISVDSFTQPDNGTVTQNPDGTLKYTPDPDFNGSDSFTYTITDGNGGTDTATVNLTVDPENDDPIALDDSDETEKDTAIDIDVLTNDFDIDGDTLIVSETGQGSDGTVSINPDGTVKYTPDAGFVGTDTFTYTVSDGEGGTDTATVSITVPCFTPGTFIETARGRVLVEQLRVGDRVKTLDHGLQPVEWIGTREIVQDELAAHANWRPIQIDKGALGAQMPDRDMLVSPQHRMMIESDKAELHFGEREVLAPAKSLTFLDGVRVVDMDRITYIHVMCKAHEIIMADGVWTESFQPGDISLAGMDEPQRAELTALFPGLEGATEGKDGYGAARPTVRPWEVPLLF